MIPSAYLRVYLDRSNAGDFEAHEADVADELRGNDHFLWSEPLTNDAFLVRWRDGLYECPRYPRLRMLEGVLAFNNAFPDTALIPKDELVEASEELTRLRNQSPTVRSYILTSPWHVPTRWFTAFFHQEREVYERDGVVSLRYRAAIDEALGRVQRAVRIVADVGFDASVISQLEGLVSWLEDFPSGSMLELDYGTVAGLFSEGDLALDDSAADIAGSLLALEHGNVEEAGTFYSKVAARWSRVQALAFAN